MDFFCYGGKFTWLISALWSPQSPFRGVLVISQSQTSLIPWEGPRLGSCCTPTSLAFVHAEFPVRSPPSEGHMDPPLPDSCTFVFICNSSGPGHKDPSPPRLGKHKDTTFWSEPKSLETSSYFFSVSHSIQHPPPTIQHTTTPPPPPLPHHTTTPILPPPPPPFPPYPPSGLGTWGPFAFLNTHWMFKGNVWVSMSSHSNA